MRLIEENKGGGNVVLGGNEAALSVCTVAWCSPRYSIDYFMACLKACLNLF